MSQSTVVFYGLRFEISGDEIEACEDRTHAHIVTARRHGLAHFWDEVSGDGQRYVLFVGSRLGWLGPENDLDVGIQRVDLLRVIESTDAKLMAAGFQEFAALHIQWLPAS